MSVEAIPGYRPACATCLHPMDAHWGHGSDSGCHGPGLCSCPGYRYPWEALA